MLTIDAAGVIRAEIHAKTFNIISLQLSKLCFSIRKKLPISAKFILGETMTTTLRSNGIRSAVLTAVTALTTTTALNAWSQQAPKQAAPDQSLEEVVVTGSRIERTGF